MVNQNKKNVELEKLFLEKRIFKSVKEKKLNAEILDHFSIRKK